eukprot:3094864-Ditylum_brightwellii.AAC.1
MPRWKSADPSTQRDLLPFFQFISPPAMPTTKIKDVLGKGMAQQMMQWGSKIITAASNLVVPLKMGAQKKIDEVA